MNWDAHILDLLQHGHSPKEVVDLINHPTITLEYIDKVQKVHIRRIGAPDVHNKYSTGTPKPGTQQAVLHEYRNLIGAEAFAKEIEDTSRKRLADKLGVTRGSVETYLQRYLWTDWKAPLKHLEGFDSYEEKLKAQGKLKPKPNIVTKQQYKHLW